VNRRIWCNGCASVTPLNVTFGKTALSGGFFVPARMPHHQHGDDMLASAIRITSMVITMVISI